MAGGQTGQRESALASAAPVREPGTRARSGNSMLRTRTAILSAAATCVERCGVRKTTMSDVAEAASVAKATLYNHFRTKDDVLTALVAARLQTLTAECTALAQQEEQGLRTALVRAATELANSGPLRRVVADEPAVLARLVVPGPGRPWLAARSAIRAVLGAAGGRTDPAAVDVVLRWLLGQLSWPGTREEVELGADLLGSGLRAPTKLGSALGWPV